MKFFDNQIVSNPGSPEKVIYNPKVLDNGIIELVEVGKENLQEYIDSFAESTDIAVILARYRAGDLTALNQRQGTFGDFTNLPKTYAEFLQLQIDSNNLFNSLPKAVRDKFDNDPNQFFAQAGNAEWYDKCALVLSDEMRSMINNMNAVVDPADGHDGEEVKVGE